MSVIATVVDGKITNQTTPTDNSKATETKESNSALDKDAFLQLLVAQMKYQDPLEPTSNTEYISQLASFSELEEMQNVSKTMDMQRASALVGQYVFMKSTDSTGNTSYPEGQVDYVVYQNGKAYLSINENLYNLDDLDTVADPEYLLASRLYTSFSAELNQLPNPDLISKDKLSKVQELMEIYDNMTDYQKSFISKEDMELYQKYVDKYDEFNPISDEKAEDTANAEPEEKE